VEFSFWDERYAENESDYGFQPNAFFKKNSGNISPGALLLPNEGEGRNGQYAAKKG
jgi:hypothetical protein